MARRNQESAPAIAVPSSLSTVATPIGPYQTPWKAPQEWEWDQEEFAQTPWTV